MRRGHDHSEGRSQLERLGAELVARETGRETHEMLRVARIEARGDQAAAAISQLHDLMAELWRRIEAAAPTTIVFSHQQLQLEAARLEWEIAHEVIAEGAFARSGWDVYAGAHLRLHQTSEHQEYPGRSASLWYARRPRTLATHWIEVAYDAAEGNAPSEEPFALKDLIKADLVAAGGETNLYHAAAPAPIDAADADAFCDRWMGLLARAATGDLERPSRDHAAPAYFDAEPEEEEEDAQAPAPVNPLMARLKLIDEQ